MNAIQIVQNMKNAGYADDQIFQHLNSAIKGYTHFIDKESARSADLRPASVQKTLDQYIALRAELKKAITTI